MSLDYSIFKVIYNFSGKSAVLDFIGIFLSEYLGYFLILAFVVFFFRYRRSFAFFSFVSLSLLLSRGLIAEIIKFIYSSPRPFAELGFKPLINHLASSSFPSSHATIFFTLAFALWLVNKRFGYWFMVLAFLVGVARVFVGVHWPLDVVGGVLVALLSVIVIKWILPRGVAENTAEAAR